MWAFKAHSMSYRQTCWQLDLHSTSDAITTESPKETPTTDQHHTIKSLRDCRGRCSFLATQVLKGALSCRQEWRLPLGLTGPSCLLNPWPRCTQQPTATTSPCPVGRFGGLGLLSPPRKPCSATLWEGLWHATWNLKSGCCGMHCSLLPMCGTLL